MVTPKPMAKATLGKPTKFDQSVSLSLNNDLICLELFEVHSGAESRVQIFPLPCAPTHAEPPRSSAPLSKAIRCLWRTDGHPHSPVTKPRVDLWVCSLLCPVRVWTSVPCRSPPLQCHTECLHGPAHPLCSPQPKERSFLGSGAPFHP